MPSGLLSMMLMFETSTQAQFLIPMAITIVFGLGIATLLVLVIVPSMVAIGADVRTLAGRIRGRTNPEPAEAR